MPRIQTYRKKHVVDIFTTDEYKKAFFDQLPIGVALVAEDGTWIDVNEKVLEYFEYTKGEMLEKKWEHVTAGSDIKADWEESRNVIQGKSDGFYMHKTYITKTLRPFWALIIVKGVHTEEGDFKHFISFILPVKSIYRNLFLTLRSIKHLKKGLGSAVFLLCLGLYKLGFISFEELLKAFKSFIF